MPAASAVTEEEPEPVDFDALHAALGEPLAYDEMAGPAVEKGGTDELLDGLEAGLAAARGNQAPISESLGRSSATYASSRPRTIPPTRASSEDPNAPAVIVASDDTVPSAPPQMTVPLAPGQRGAPGVAGGTGPAALGMNGPPSSNPALAHGAMPGHPSSGGQHNAPAAPGYGQTPMPFPVPGRGAPQLTARMPDRPVNPRRGKVPTVVVRSRGPSAKQKLVAFMAMLVLVTACGIAVIVWRKPQLLGLDAPGDPSAMTSVTTAQEAPTVLAPPATTVTAPPPPTATVTAAVPVATVTTAADASVVRAPPKKVPKAPAPRPSAPR